VCLAGTLSNVLDVVGWLFYTIIKQLPEFAAPALDNFLKCFIYIISIQTFFSLKDAIKDTKILNMMLVSGTAWTIARSS
jgi:hypothetical protein